MSLAANRSYEFGPFRLDAEERQLFRDGAPVSLPPKVFETLLALVEHNGHVQGKEELMKRVWPDTFVEENNLTKNISELRKVLGEGQNGGRYIETVPKRGYRFIASVKKDWGEGAELIVEEHTRTRVITEEEEETGDNETTEKTVVSSGTFSMPNERAVIEAKARAVEPKGAPARITHPVGISRRHRRSIVLSLAALIAAGAVASALYKFSSRDRPKSVPAAVAPFQRMKLERLTVTGRAVDAAVSPDGKYVAYVVLDGGRRSLWLRQLATASNIQIAAPVEGGYGYLTFTRDGSHIFYTKREKNTHFTLYQIPLLGGVPRKVVENIQSPVTLSPDGKQLAFIRWYPEQAEMALIIANADGTEERRLATRKRPVFLSYGGAAWSPDGKVIVFAVRNPDDDYRRLFEVNVVDGKEKEIASYQWLSVGRLAWLKDGSGLVASASDQSGASQLWHLSYPGGEVRRITNDLNSYTGVSMTEDSGSLVTILGELRSNVWTIAPGADASRAKQITFGRIEGDDGITLAPDGKVIYTSNAGGEVDVWMMEADGTGQRQLTFGAGRNVLPEVSPDGRYIVFVSNRTGSNHIWRVDADGRNLRQVTDGAEEVDPHISPDGQWMVYAAADSSNSWALWKIPIEGGQPVRLTDRPATYPVVSPDGKLVACNYMLESPSQPQQWRIAIVPFEGGQPVKVLDVPTFPLRQIGWTPDGHSLTYVETRDEVSNIWSLPIDGAPPKQLTGFKTDRIFSFAWTQDGKQLLYARGALTSDVILISGFR
jgi:eukaryotic-like serine/threonine-protein kinase